MAFLPDIVRDIMKIVTHFCLALITVAAVANVYGAGTNNIATNAIVSTSYVSSWEDLQAIQDGHDPVSSTDKTGGAYGNWPTTGTNWVEYQWPDAPLGVKVDKIQAYWWTDNGGIMPPSACWLDYWDGTNYVPVPNPAGLGVALNRYNTTSFTPVTTDRLRLRFASGAASTGILEWKVYGDAVVLEPVSPIGENSSGRSIRDRVEGFRRRLFPGGISGLGFHG